MIRECVIDACVAAKLFVEEELAMEARELFAALTTDPSSKYLVPDLFYVETVNILGKYARRKEHGYQRDQLRKDFALLIKVGLEVVSARDLLQDALELSLRHNIKIYDAVYAALAQREALPLITADDGLIRTFKNSAIDVWWLGELQDFGWYGSPMETTDPRGRSFLSYSRTRLAEARLLIEAQHDVGIPTWQDLANLGEEHTEEKLREVLFSPQTANAVLWVSPEVRKSAMIKKVEAPRVFARLDRDDNFFALIATAGGLDYRNAAAILDTYLGSHQIDEHNCRKIESDPLTPGEAAQVAERVLRGRLRRIHGFLPTQAPLRLSLMTLRAPSFEPAEHDLVLDWHSRFNLGPGHRQAPSETWTDYLLPALRTVREVLRSEVPGRPIEASGLLSLAAATALGCTFSSLDRSFSLAWRQLTGGREDLWSLQAPPEPSGFRAITRGSDPKAEDLAVLVSVRAAVDGAFKASNLPRFRAITRVEPANRGPQTYPFLIASPGQAVDVARITIEEILRARQEYLPRRVHLFMSVPAGLAMLIGQQLNTLGPVQTYEHLQEGAVGLYRPAALVEATL